MTARYVAGPWFLLLAACGGPVPPWQEPPAAQIVLQARLDPPAVPLLGETTIRLDLYWRSGTVAFDPRVPDGCRGEVLPGVTEPWGGGTWRTVTVRLRPLRGPGELTIPPFVARTDDGIEARSAELKLMVTSVLPDGDGGGIEAPGEPFAGGPAWGRWLGWGAGVAAAALVLLSLFLWRRRRPAPAVPLPPHARARRELQRLRAAPRRTPAEIDLWYVGVSSVLRVYLEERFGLRAPERTTEEFLLELRGSAALDARQQAELQGFLQQCDLVKFAGAVPTEPAHLAVLQAAEGLVEATAADRAPAAEVVA